MATCNVTAPSNVQPAGVDDDDSNEWLWASHHVLAQLGINPGEETKVFVAYVEKDVHNPFVSASIYIAKKLGDYRFNIAKDDKPQRTNDFLFFIKVDLVEDITKLHGHMWYFYKECMTSAASRTLMSMRHMTQSRGSGVLGK
ncbi:unnamed protein product [Urochloa humidicola]